MPFRQWAAPGTCGPGFALRGVLFIADGAIVLVEVILAPIITTILIAYFCIDRIIDTSWTQLAKCRSGPVYRSPLTRAMQTPQGVSDNRLHAVDFRLAVRRPQAATMMKRTR
jgi:hypothetical protein